MIFIFATRSRCLTTPPTSSCMKMVTHSVYFQRGNDSKISTLIKACQSLLAKNCHAKGRELTPRIYLQLRRVDRRSQKFSEVCSMLLDKIGQLSVGLLDLRWLIVSKKILEEKFFAWTNFCELVFDRENRENFCLTKYSRYTVSYNTLQSDTLQFHAQLSTNENAIQLFPTFFQCNQLLTEQ